MRKLESEKGILQNACAAFTRMTGLPLKDMGEAEAWGLTVEADGKKVITGDPISKIHFHYTLSKTKSL